MGDIQDCCSFESQIKGVMFYDGRVHLRTFSTVIFERDYNNSRHKRAFFAKLEEGDVLGHVTWKVAEVLHILVAIPDIEIKGYLYKLHVYK